MSALLRAVKPHCYSLRDSYVQPTDYRFARVFGMDVEQLKETVLNGDYASFDDYGKFIDRLIPMVVGGYSRVDQDYDPRIIRRDEDWLVLPSIDSMPHNDVYMGWGDSGVANWWIKREDLARGDFSRVMYHCD